MSKKRAAGELEKEARRNEILARADELFKAKDLSEIKMADLAADLGLAKGTLYLYFPSKESLFLALLSDRLDSVLDGLGEALSAAQGDAQGAASVEALAAWTAASISSDLAFPRLLADLHPVLERNLPFEEAVAFKRALAAKLEETGLRISEALPPLSAQEGLRFILYVYAQVVGLASLTDLSPFMRKVGAQPGLELYKLGFEDALRDSSRAMLAGLVQAARERELSRGEGEPR
jgi:AcrR family transcriptional regulator